ncbi:MAG: HEPN domain-containing protein [Bacteroidaceae bacterium]|nr:HEPN domain-containing protein [Bacteroidaceae bacterium]
MSLSDQERQTIVSMEMEKAHRTFADMEFCANKQRWEATANRLYYALFHAVSALLISGGHNVKSHRGTLSQFGQHYVRTGVFSREDGSLLSDLVIMRDNADYNLFFEATEEKIAPYIKPTKQLIEKIEQYIHG